MKILEQMKTRSCVSGFHWSALEFPQTFASVFIGLWRHRKHCNISWMIISVAMQTFFFNLLVILHGTLDYEYLLTLNSKTFSREIPSILFLSRKVKNKHCIRPGWRKRSGTLGILGKPFDCKRLSGIHVRLES